MLQRFVELAVVPCHTASRDSIGDHQVSLAGRAFGRDRPASGCRCYMSANPCVPGSDDRVSAAALKPRYSLNGPVGVEGPIASDIPKIINPKPVYS